MNEKTNVFTISDRYLANRGRNILWGAVLSRVLVAAIAFGRHRYPETYTDVLLWSVVAFVIGANPINYLRQLRYLRLIRIHSLEVTPGKVRFRTGTEESTLDLDDIALINLFRTKGDLRHIQIRLRNGRGIRLEGYENLERMAGHPAFNKELRVGTVNVWRCPATASRCRPSAASRVRARLQGRRGGGDEELHHGQDLFAAGGLM